MVVMPQWGPNPSLSVTAVQFFSLGQSGDLHSAVCATCVQRTHGGSEGNMVYPLSAAWRRGSKDHFLNLSS